MPNAEIAGQISTALRRHLERERVEEIEAVPAAKVLERLGVLNDDSQRPGLPLRRYLRAGLVPGAFKDSSGRWIIRRQALS